MTPRSVGRSIGRGVRSRGPASDSSAGRKGQIRAAVDGARVALACGMIPAEIRFEHPGAGVLWVVVALVVGVGFALGAVGVSFARSLALGVLFAVPALELVAMGAVLGLRAFTFGVSALTLETRPGL